jgi:hypothetical protein
MVHNTQNYWVFGLYASSGILENMTFRKLDLFPSSGEGGGEDTYSVGPLRKSYSQYQTMEKVQKPSNLCNSVLVLLPDVILRMPWLMFNIYSSLSFNYPED